MSSNAICIEPVTPRIGALVRGVDLTRPLSPVEVESLEQAWARHLVLFFRDQQMGRESLLALARVFGELHVHPQGDVEGYPGLIAIHSDASTTRHAGRTWHSDVTCDLRPPAASILHLHEVPEDGGDTLFADMYAAFEALSAPLQAFLCSLEAFHSGRPNMEGYYGMSAEELRDKTFPEARHPVVRVHPVTGREALFVNEIFTQHICGLAPSESRALLDFLYAHLAQPRFQCRFRWEKNSIAMWDNRCSQHMAIHDYHPQIRSGHRATIVGDRPMGVG